MVIDSSPCGRSPLSTLTGGPTHACATRGEGHSFDDEFRRNITDVGDLVSANRLGIFLGRSCACMEILPRTTAQNTSRFKHTLAGMEAFTRSHSRAVSSVLHSPADKARVESSAPSQGGIYFTVESLRVVAAS
jgi:hypothetical protein